MDSNKKIWMTLGGIALVMLFIIVLQIFVRTPYTTMKIAVLPEGEYDPAVWGQYYPLEYKSYLKNKEMNPPVTGYGGSEKTPKRIKEPEILINFKGIRLRHRLQRGPGTSLCHRGPDGNETSRQEYRRRLHDLQNGLSGGFLQRDGMGLCKNSFVRSSPPDQATDRLRQLP